MKTILFIVFALIIFSGCTKNSDEIEKSVFLYENSDMYIQTCTYNSGYIDVVGVFKNTSSASIGILVQRNGSFYYESTYPASKQYFDCKIAISDTVNCSVYVLPDCNKSEKIKLKLY